MRAFVVVLLLSALTQLAMANKNSNSGNSFGDSQEITESSLRALATDVINHVVALPIRILSRALFSFLELPYDAAQSVWSWIQPGSKLPGVSKLGAKMLSGGLLAGVASRIFDTDLVEHGLGAIMIEKSCRSMAACEFGAYILHSNKAFVSVITSIFDRLFEPTSMHWEPLRKGLHGAVCHRIYTACDKEFLMKR